MYRSTIQPIAIVMGRNYTSRLGMIRAAGMAGCDVIDIQTSAHGEKLNKIDASSKYVIKTFICEESRKDISAYDRTKNLISLIKEQTIAKQKIILLPTDDYTASAIDLHIDELKDNFLFPNILNTSGRVVELMDKSLQKDLAEKVGIKVAKGWSLKYSDEGYIIPQDIIYPCFVKPESSYLTSLKNHMKCCNNETELNSLLHSLPKNYKGNILVEQYIQIKKEYAILGLSLNGNSIIPAVIQMTSSYLGVTATGKIFPINVIEGLEVKLKDFMKQTQLTGLFDIDLYVDQNDNIYFNELNARFGASGYAITKSVMNLPELFINYIKGYNIDLSIPQFSEKTFANEKVCSALLFHNNLKYNEFKERLSEADFCFICQQDDIKPYKVFEKENFKSFIFNRIKHIFK